MEIELTKITLLPARANLRIKCALECGWWYHQSSPPKQIMERLVSIRDSCFELCALSFVLCDLWFVICDLWFVINFHTSIESTPTKDKVPSTKYEIQSTKYEVQSTKHKVQSTKYEVQTTKYKVRNSKHEVLSLNNSRARRYAKPTLFCQTAYPAHWNLERSSRTVIAVVTRDWTPRHLSRVPHTELLLGWNFICPNNRRCKIH